MRTAVCWREVVAPPMSSGSFSPRRCISVATLTISSSDGVIRPDRPTASAPSATAVSRMVAAGTMTPEVDDLVVVAAEDDPDDVLADVVDVALDRGEHDLALAAIGAGVPALAGLLLLGFHVGLQVGHRAFHHPRALDHLREEHLARAEQVADDLHAVHQRPLDHVKRPGGLLPGLLGVGLGEVGDAVHQRVRQALLHRSLAPGQVHHAGGAWAAHRLGERHQPVGGVGTPVEDHVLDQLEQVGRDIGVDRELAGVDDAHVQPGRDGVEQERRVHRLADHVVAAEGERQVGDAAAGPDPGAALP